VLDPRQLIRIESVHRGFLYQHLYAAACLLSAATAGIRSIIVEADEDIELLGESRRLYVQVKTRTGTLAIADIEDSLARFSEIRGECETGAKDGRAQLTIVSNAAPNGPLAKRIVSNDWRSDVEVLWPGGPHPSDPALVRPAHDLAGMFAICRERAAILPLSMVGPDTLGHIPINGIPKLVSV
jgi:hypothetical protein